MTVLQLIKAALAEDIGRGDITTRLIVPARHRSTGFLTTRAPGVLAGIRVCGQVFRAVDPRLRFKTKHRDGARIARGARLAEVSGSTRSILAAERTALNFLQRLSGIATLTSRFVAAVAGTKAAILDTRKTTPGWRQLEKCAVRCGGGTNHRMGLYDAIIIKDNHVAAAGSVAAALARCRKARLRTEIEVRNLTELRQALQAGARYVMLDNMNLTALRRAVAITGGRAKLEASGRISLSRVRAVARTGVDFISVGALTHSAPAVDISLELNPA